MKGQHMMPGGKMMDDADMPDEMKAMRKKMLAEAMKKRRKTGGKYGQRPPVEVD